MASHLSTLLLGLKASALRSLAVAIGVNSTGAKAQIAARIAKSCCEDVGFFDRSHKCCEKGNPQKEAEMRESDAEIKQKMKRVLSIDMGIRNLALCVIEVPTGGKNPVGEALPKVIAWETIAVSEKLVEEPIGLEESVPETESTPTKKSKRRKSASPDLDEPIITEKPRKPKEKKESFEPSKFAVIANNFVHTTLSRFSPDAILIEQQRYRSQGASAIQQWTIRVNMFEAMLHALFYSVGCVGCGEDAQRKSPAAESISPSRVSGFWIDRVGKTFEMKSDRSRDGESRNVVKVVESEPKGQEAVEEVSGVKEMGVEEAEVEVEKDGEGKERERGEEVEVEVDGSLGVVNKDMNTELREKKAFGNIKQAKVFLVSEWIKNGDVISFNKEVADTVGNFVPYGAVDRKKAKGAPRKKLDDLADCLLQGVAWLRWEENRKSLAEGRLIPELLPWKCTSCQDRDS